MTTATPLTEADRPPLTVAESDQAIVGKLKGLAGAMLLLLAMVSFTAGVPGLVSAGQQAQLGGLAFLTPVIIDAGLVFFAITALVGKAETGRISVLPWTLVVALSGISVAAQIVHSFSGHGWTVNPESLIGAVVASIFPLTVLASTRAYETLRFGQIVERQAKRAARGQAPARSKRPATSPAVAPSQRPAQSGPVPLRPVAVAASARPASAASKPRSSQAYPPEFRAEALGRLAHESERAVAADLGIGRSTLQSWKSAPAT